MVVRLIGRLLRPVRAGVVRLAWHDRAVAQAPATLTVTSDDFRDGGPMPQRCEQSRKPLSHRCFRAP